jgi:hypothetical protein
VNTNDRAIRIIVLFTLDDELTGTDTAELLVMATGAGGI